MDYYVVCYFAAFLLLLPQASCASLQVRTKRIDRVLPADEREEPNQRIRTKRIELLKSTADKKDNINLRTKRIELDKTEMVEVHVKINSKNTDRKITSSQKMDIPFSTTTENSFVQTSTEEQKADTTESTEKKSTPQSKMLIYQTKSSTMQSKTSTKKLKMSTTIPTSTPIYTTENENQEENYDSYGDDSSTMNEIEINNNIPHLRGSVLGICRGKKVNRTYSTKNCEDVTIEMLVCGGVCEPTPLQLFENFFHLNGYDTCTYCGPEEFEEKLIFFQCHSGSRAKRRRWKLELRKITIPKSCGCVREPCHKLNVVSQEQFEQNGFFKR